MLCFYVCEHRDNAVDEYGACYSFQCIELPKRRGYAYLYFSSLSERQQRYYPEISKIVKVSMSGAFDATMMPLPVT
jgi:hypothetical protein